MKSETIKSSAIGISSQCRCDAKYGVFVSEEAWNAFQYHGELQTLGDLLIQMPIKKVSKGELSDTYYLINIVDQEPTIGIVDDKNVNIAEMLDSDKTILSECDILVSKLGMTRGYIYLKPQVDSELIGSSEYIPYKLRDIDNSYFYLYLLLMPQLRDAYRCLETGKTPSHKRVNPFEFLKIKVPVIEHDIVHEANEEIKNIVNQIKEIKSQMISLQSIIDDVFSKNFLIDPNLRNQLHKGMTFGTQSSNNTRFSTYSISITSLSKYDGLRFSARSHSPLINNILDIIKNNGFLKLSDVAIDIHNGKKPEYSTYEDVVVIKTANISNNGLRYDDAQHVNNIQYDSSPDAQILQNDVLICNIGKCSLGKADICLTQDRLFAVTETMIIRVDPLKYSPSFLLHYLRSVFGTAQFEIEYTGTTNQIHISPKNVGNFIIPNIPLETQNKIVEEINHKVSSQNAIKAKIDELRRKINIIIEKAIFENVKH